MGACGSKPPVQDDVKPSARPPAPQKPAVEKKPVETAPIETKAPQVQQPAAQEAPDRAIPPGRKSKSLELPNASRPDVNAQSPVEGAGSEQPKGDGDDDDSDDGGEWKVRRRVSRRLSLEVHKKPGSKTGSPSPGFGPTPTADEKAAWDAAADADIIGPVDVKNYQPNNNQASEDFQRGLPASVAGRHALPEPVTKVVRHQASALSTGQSRLGPGHAGGAAAEDDDEGEDGGAWKTRRRGRRLSLEAEKTPDLALLAAIRRSTSAPITADAARRAVREALEEQGQEPDATGLLIRNTGRGSPGSKSGGESAVISPAAHSATVIDFAQKLTVDIGVDSNIEDFEDAPATSPPQSVKIAQALVSGTPEGSPEQFRARRRKSRRLSLEIEKQPDEAVLAAVRRTHSAPVTSGAARAAMGERAWAAVIAGNGGEYSPSMSEVDVGRDSGATERATAGGNVVPSGAAAATSAQEARAMAWNNSKMVEFGNDDEDEEDEVEASGTDQTYVRVNPKGTSRRRSMDVYKRAVASGASVESATELARRYDPSFTLDGNAAAEEADLIGPEGDEENSASSDFSEWTGSAVQAKPKPRSKWTDYNDSAESSESNRRFGGAYGNEAPTGAAPTSLAGISV